MKSYMKHGSTLIILVEIFLISSFPVFGLSLGAHEEVNTAAYNYFIDHQGKEGKYSGSQLDESTTFSGVAWHDTPADYEKWLSGNSGILRSERFSDWVKIGGFDSDVDSPGIWQEKPARHFFDPAIQPPWLTDLPIVLSKIDHTTWAISDKDHHWSWNQGLQLYKAAMEMGNNVSVPIHPLIIDDFNYYFGKSKPSDPKTLKDNLFAASFRALGETLHGIGDMSVPAHVRDDAHGGLKYKYDAGLYEYGSGGEDPYEMSVSGEMVKSIAQGRIELPADMAVKPLGKPADEIMRSVAVYTNSSFFSADTIYDQKLAVIPRSKSGKKYPSPSLSDGGLRKNEIMPGTVLWYGKDFSNSHGVVRLAELTVSGLVFKKNDYSVSASFAREQANVLIPIAIIGCSEAIDRFFPTMELTMAVTQNVVGNVTKYQVDGVLKHKSELDIAWGGPGGPGEIFYSGNGEIVISYGSSGSSKKRLDVSFSHGSMATAKDLEFSPGDQVQIVVQAGGRTYQSNVFSPQGGQTTLALTGISIAPTSVSVNPGGTYNLGNIVVTATYPDNSTKTVTGTWSKKSGNGSVSGSTYTAPSAAGADVLTCTYVESGVTKTIDLTVTVSAMADTTKPEISAVTSGSLTATSAVITWTTDEDSTSQVEYGTTTAYGSTTTLDSNKAKSHSVSVTGLTAATAYHYRVKSKDAANNEAVSADNTFTTNAVQTGTPTEINLGGGITMKFVSIPAGTFTMGSPGLDQYFGTDEIQHQVTISKDFYIGIYEVTQGQYKQIAGNNPSYFTPSNSYSNNDVQPVEQVSWYDAVEFCNKLSQQQSLTPAYNIDKVTADPNNQDSYDSVKWLVTTNWSANGYRLPTEAEWEYACRAGTTSMYYWADSYDEAQTKQYAWFWRNANDSHWTVPHAEKGGPQPVGTNLSNDFALFDMGGNVAEWCYDWKDTFSSIAQTDPKGATGGFYRVVRGGSWYSSEAIGSGLRSASRSGNDSPSTRGNTIGFRICRTKQ